MKNRIRGVARACLQFTFGIAWRSALLLLPAVAMIQFLNAQSNTLYPGYTNTNRGHLVYYGTNHPVALNLAVANGELSIPPDSVATHYETNQAVYFYSPTADEKNLTEALVILKTIRYDVLTFKWNDTDYSITNAPLLINETNRAYKLNPVRLWRPQP